MERRLHAVPDEVGTLDMGIEAVVYEHLTRVDIAPASLAVAVPVVARWAGTLALRLSHGQRLFVAGNGMSGSGAQRLTAELVDRFGSSVTAMGTDFGFEETFARRVAVHGRPLDVLLVLETGGRSRDPLR